MVLFGYMVQRIQREQARALNIAGIVANATEAGAITTYQEQKLREQLFLVDGVDESTAAELVRTRNYGRIMELISPKIGELRQEFKLEDIGDISRRVFGE